MVVFSHLALNGDKDQPCHTVPPYSRYSMSDSIRTVSKRFSCQYTHAFSELKGAKFKVHHPVCVITVCMQLFLFLNQDYAGMISHTVVEAQSKPTIVIPYLNLSDLKVPLFCAEGSERNRKGLNVKDDNSNSANNHICRMSNCHEY